LKGHSVAEALVLERIKQLSLREIDLPQDLGPGDVRIRTEVVGICGSDVHYYLHGRIGPFVVREPMVLGHEAAGIVVEVGTEVADLKAGDRVCVEPGVPDFSSRAARLGLYNLDPSLSFWATPPIHGCLTPEVVHPANLCFKLPHNVTAAQGAMVEPLAVCIQAATKAQISPGDKAVVLGAGPIGLMQALAALASGCSEVFIFDPLDNKLALAARYDGVTPLYSRNGPPAEQISDATLGWGADVVFECSGASAAFRGIADLLRPGGVSWHRRSAAAWRYTCCRRHANRSGCGGYRQPSGQRDHPADNLSLCQCLRPRDQPAGQWPNQFGPAHHRHILVCRQHSGF